jgi:ribosomal protein L29
MTTKTMKELEKMSDQELSALVETERATVQQHRFGMGGRDVMKARAAKTNVARALTILSARSKEATNS